MRRGPRLAALLAPAVIAAACGSSGATSIVVSGSSTVEPISARVAEQFAAANSGVAISVSGPGTGDGFKLFCNGETDVSDASRPIKDSEVETCASNGVNFVELKVAIDGLSVLTSPNNSAIECLGYPDLYALVGPESTGFGRWSDASALAIELGSAYAPYPDLALDITAPGEESGTFDTFVELTLEDIAEERGQDGTTRPDYTSTPNDNVIIEGLSGSDTSLGWVGYVFFVENRDKVAAIPIDSGDGNCVVPSDESIADGSYPLARDLFIYVNTDTARQQPLLAAFID